MRGSFGIAGFLFVSSLAWQAEAKPVYGNWCGQGGKGEPIDVLDEACKAHDRCFDSHSALRKKTAVATFGYCGCDAALLQTLKGLGSLLRQHYKDQKNKLQKALDYRKLGLSIYEVQLCIRAKKKVCKTLKIPTGKTEKKCTKIAGKKVCADVPVIESKEVCTDDYDWGKGGK